MRLRLRRPATLHWSSWPDWSLACEPGARELPMPLVPAPSLDEVGGGPVGRFELAALAESWLAATDPDWSWAPALVSAELPLELRHRILSGWEAARRDWRERIYEREPARETMSSPQRVLPEDSSLEGISALVIRNPAGEVLPRVRLRSLAAGFIPSPQYSHALAAFQLVWPDLGVKGRDPVDLVVEVDRLPHRFGLEFSWPETRDAPATLVRLWRPEPVPDLEASFRGLLALRLPADLWPAPGTELTVTMAAAGWGGDNFAVVHGVRAGPGIQGAAPPRGSLTP